MVTDHNKIGIQWAPNHIEAKLATGWWAQLA